MRGKQWNEKLPLPCKRWEPSSYVDVSQPWAVGNYHPSQCTLAVPGPARHGRSEGTIHFFCAKESLRRVRSCMAGQGAAIPAHHESHSPREKSWGAGVPVERSKRPDCERDPLIECFAELADRNRHGALLIQGSTFLARC